VHTASANPENIARIEQKAFERLDDRFVIVVECTA
jgi:hypothetical protein